MTSRAIRAQTHSTTPIMINEIIMACMPVHNETSLHIIARASHQATISVC